MDFQCQDTALREMNEQYFVGKHSALMQSAEVCLMIAYKEPIEPSVRFRFMVAALLDICCVSTHLPTNLFDLSALM